MATLNFSGRQRDVLDVASFYADQRRPLVREELEPKPKFQGLNRKQRRTEAAKLRKLKLT